MRFATISERDAFRSTPLLIWSARTAGIPVMTKVLQILPVRISIRSSLRTTQIRSKCANSNRVFSNSGAAPGSHEQYEVCGSRANSRRYYNAHPWAARRGFPSPRIRRTVCCLSSLCGSCAGVGRKSRGTCDNSGFHDGSDQPSADVSFRR
jgi:hypothetical protein